MEICRLERTLDDTFKQICRETYYFKQAPLKPKTIYLLVTKAICSYGDKYAFGAGLKWPFVELQFLIYQSQRMLFASHRRCGCCAGSQLLHPLCIKLTFLSGGGKMPLFSSQDVILLSDTYKHILLFTGQTKASYVRETTLSRFPFCSLSFTLIPVIHTLSVILSVRFSLSFLACQVSHHLLKAKQIYRLPPS